MFFILFFNNISTNLRPNLFIDGTHSKVKGDRNIHIINGHRCIFCIFYVYFFRILNE